MSPLGGDSFIERSTLFVHLRGIPLAHGVAAMTLHGFVLIVCGFALVVQSLTGMDAFVGHSFPTNPSNPAVQAGNP